MWHHIENQKYELTQANKGFLEQTYFLPLEIFVNEYTGEVKLFSRKLAENIGISNILYQLNNESENDRK